jgi:hypothetical protein
MQLLDHRVRTLEDNHDELKDVLRELTSAMNKLVIIDEKQIQSALIMDRLAGDIRDVKQTIKEQAERHEKTMARLGERIGPLEIAAPQHKQTSQWVTGGIVGAAVLAAQFVAVKVGLK